MATDYVTSPMLKLGHVIYAVGCGLMVALIRQFGKSDYDMTKSVFYNPTTKKLEMWLPEYGTDLYYHIDAADVSGSQLKVSTTFYNEKEKSTLFGKAAITVEVADGKPLIRSVSTQTE